MSIIERSGEKIARFTDRRKFLKRAAITVFSFATASAISLDQVLTVFARTDCNNNNSYCPWNSKHAVICDCQCEPINGNYCSSFSWGSCNGASCSGNCKADTYAWPNTNGCWCTLVCLDGCYDRYIKCCDCNCGNGNFCTCSQIIVVGGARC